MGYEHDMKGEAKAESLLPEGNRIMQIIDMIPEVSKAGNDMFIAKLQDEKTKQVKTTYLVAVKGKRWMLKQLLSACGIEADGEGVYKWDFPDVMQKKVIAVIEHREEEWINRNGEAVKSKKSDIVEFLPYNGNPEGVTNASDVKWDE